MELITDEKMLRENIGLVKRSIGFISRGLSEVEREIRSELGSSLTMGLRTIQDRIGFLEMEYNKILQEFEKIQGLYPIEKRNNILKKISTVEKALESLADLLKDLAALKVKFQNLPTKLFD